MAEWVPSLLLFILAAGLAYHGVSFYRAGQKARLKGEASLLWPRTPGRIVASTVEYVSEGDFDGAQPGFYIPSVAYTYAVGGSTFTGTEIAMRDLRSWKKTATALVGHYPVGSDVEVSYDPAAPENSLLEPGAKGMGRTFVFAALEVLVALAITAAGVIIPIFHLHN